MPLNNPLNNFIQKADIAALPILPKTLQVLKEVLEKPIFNYRLLDHILQFDPACMINLLAYANQEINKDFDKEISQVEHAAMFLGMDRIEKFISNISSLYSIKNKKIADKLTRLQHRGVHAAFQAQNFAQLMNNSAMSEIYTSALITPISELVCWHLEPVKAQKVELLVYQQNADYEQAQRDIFGFSYHELAEALTHHWRIPSLFLHRQEMHDLDNASQSIKCLYLAEKCSIFAEQGWYYDNMYNHIKLCEKTFHFSEARITHELHQTAVNMAHQLQDFYPIQNTTSYLVLLAGKVPYTQIIAIQAKEKKKPKIEQKTPKAADSETRQKPEQRKISSVDLIYSANDFPTLMRLTMDSLFETKTLSRIAFMMLSKDKQQLIVRSVRGFKNHRLSSAIISLQPANLFTKLLAKPQSIIINQQNYQKFSSLINPALKEVLDVKEFIAKSIHINNKPIGIFYMDKHPLEDNKPQTTGMEYNSQIKTIFSLYDKQVKKLTDSR